jgi:hypothetical protein
VQRPWITRTDDNRPFLIVAISLIGLAWLSLAVWGMSPYSRYLSHDALDLILSGSNSYLIGVFIGGWVLMIIAMAEGWKIWQMLDPDSVDDAMLEEMMEHARQLGQQASARGRGGYREAAS